MRGSCRITQTLINQRPPLNRDCSRDPNIIRHLKEGVINHGSTLLQNNAADL